METETMDKLFLELSQFTTAKTKRELQLEEALRLLKSILLCHEPYSEKAQEIVNKALGEI